MPRCRCQCVVPRASRILISMASSSTARSCARSASPAGRRRPCCGFSRSCGSGEAVETYKAKPTRNGARNAEQPRRMTGQESEAQSDGRPVATRGFRPSGSAYRRYVSIDATTTQPSMVRRSMPANDIRAQPSITMPLSSTRSSTSMRLLPPGPRSSTATLRPFGSNQPRGLRAALRRWVDVEGSASNGGGLHISPLAQRKIASAIRSGGRTVLAMPTESHQSWHRRRSSFSGRRKSMASADLAELEMRRSRHVPVSER